MRAELRARLVVGKPELQTGLMRSSWCSRGATGDNQVVPDDSWLDASRDAVALIRLYLATGPGQEPDLTGLDAILANSNPYRIAAMSAMICAALITTLDNRGVLDSQAAMDQLQSIYLSRPAD